jgi:DNA-binding CsgD family transcriptional regulator
MKRIVLFGLAAFLLFSGLNLVEFARSGEPFDAVAMALDFAETGLLVAAVTVTAWLAVEVREIARQRSDLAQSLAKARAEGDEWRRRSQVHLRGLGEAIQAQFAAWKLTSSEAEIAMLLLKGLSHKDIAGLRATSEATVRQQSRSIYQKSGLATRSELAAYFLEDLAAPPREATVVSLPTERR